MSWRQRQRRLDRIQLCGRIERVTNNETESNSGKSSYVENPNDILQPSIRENDSSESENKHIEEERNWETVSENECANEPMEEERNQEMLWEN